jgi:hypothetical protein
VLGTVIKQVCCLAGWCSVRRLLLDMHEDAAAWLKFSSLCRKSGRIR